VVLALSGIEPAPTNMELHAWLTNQENRALDIGKVEPDANGTIAYTYSDPAKQNLMALYDGFEITQEPEFDDDPTPGPVVYSGRQALEPLALIRQITVQAADTPTGLAYGLGARQQTEEFIRHVEYIRLAFELGSIADAQRHAEHIVNIIEGQTGQFFGDHDGLHGVQSPGDGFGAIPYVQVMANTAAQAKDAPNATIAMAYHAEHVRLSSENAQNWAAQVRDAALQITEIPNIGDIGPQLEVIERFSPLTLFGEDTNGDGEISPQEGGVFTAYQHAQYMAAVGVAVGDSGAVVDALPVLEPGVEEQVAATGSVDVEMLDFEFVPISITIPAGTTVRWLNVGRDPHSATADNDLFNSDLLDSGGEYSFTFDQPGVYSYYCLLHGLPGGTGMAGTVTVEP
ncbi:MAG: plastocyanin/azurin family copper-binding protein, partial [Chloroflexota bacterium]